MTTPDTWLAAIEAKIRAFASSNSFIYSQKKREISASFEIGCFHALVDYYSELAVPELQNLVGREYRYLTSPNGNPTNFSFIRFRAQGADFELRQQVRVRWHLDPNITCTPDLVVVPACAHMDSIHYADYARGKRQFFSIDSSQVIAAHECKSLNPYPELFVSFLGMLSVTHGWYGNPGRFDVEKGKGMHLAPSLFVGGTPRGIHKRMVDALELHFPINIVLGLHTLRSVDLTQRNRLAIRIQAGDYPR